MNKKVQEYIEDVIWDPKRPCVFYAVDKILKKHVFCILSHAAVWAVVRQIRDWIQEQKAFHEAVSKKILKIQACMKENHMETDAVTKLYNHHYNIGMRYTVASLLMKDITG
jgi:predicted solute-binding protein